jgi:hypothetical protein
MADFTKKLTDAVEKHRPGQKDPDETYDRLPDL